MNTMRTRMLCISSLPDSIRLLLTETGDEARPELLQLGTGSGRAVRRTSASGRCRRTRSSAWAWRNLSVFRSPKVVKRKNGDRVYPKEAPGWNQPPGNSEINFLISAR